MITDEQKEHEGGGWLRACASARTAPCIACRAAVSALSPAVISFAKDEAMDDGQLDDKVFATFEKYDEFSDTQAKFLALCNTVSKGDEADLLLTKLVMIVSRSCGLTSAATYTFYLFI